MIEIRVLQAHQKVDMSLMWDTRRCVKIHLYGNTLKCTRSSGSGVEHG